MWCKPFVDVPELISPLLSIAIIAIVSWLSSPMSLRTEDRDGPVGVYGPQLEDGSGDTFWNQSEIN